MRHFRHDDMLGECAPFERRIASKLIIRGDYRSRARADDDARLPRNAMAIATTSSSPAILRLFAA